MMFSQNEQKTLLCVECGMLNVEFGIWGWRWCFVI